ncbi:MAG: Asp23/Gls24 family envelope stress response protein [Lachnospiraceae bacterium]|nr:Asp23/Gls24 family envelope stress response protein [Lachnospiraceae bacterium]
MQGKMENKLGKIKIDSDVIATYAGSVAVECFGIVGMAAVNVRDGLVKLLKKDYLSHGIEVFIDDNNEISLSFNVIVAYDVNIETVTRNLIETVKYKVESFTGLTVKDVHVDVSGVRVID